MGSLACDALRGGFSIGYLADRPLRLRDFDPTRGGNPLDYFFNPLAYPSLRGYVVVWALGSNTVSCPEGDEGATNEADLRPMQVGRVVFWPAGARAREALGLTGPTDTDPVFKRESVAALMSGPVATVEVSALDWSAAVMASEADLLDALALLRYRGISQSVTSRSCGTAECLVGIYQRFPAQDWWVYRSREWDELCFGPPLLLDTSGARPMTEWVTLVSRHAEGWPKVQRALRAYLRSAESEYHEDRLLEHWVGLEQLLGHAPRMAEGEDAMVGVMSRALAFDFATRRFLLDLSRDLVQWASREGQDPGETLTDVWDRRHRGVDYHALVNRLRKLAGSDVPTELRVRLLVAQEMYAQPETAQAELRRIRSRIERELYAVKRTRNQLVHEGRVVHRQMLAPLAACVEAYAIELCERKGTGLALWGRTGAFRAFWAEGLVHS